MAEPASVASRCRCWRCVSRGEMHTCVRVVETARFGMNTSISARASRRRSHHRTNLERHSRRRRTSHRRQDKLRISRGPTLLIRRHSFKCSRNEFRHGPSRVVSAEFGPPLGVGELSRPPATGSSVRSEIAWDRLCRSQDKALPISAVRGGPVIATVDPPGELGRVSHRDRRSGLGLRRPPSGNSGVWSDRYVL